MPKIYFFLILIFRDKSTYENRNFARHRSCDNLRASMYETTGRVSPAAWCLACWSPPRRRCRAHWFACWPPQTLCSTASHTVQFSQSIIGLAESIDDPLHNRFTGRHFFNFRTWTVGRGSDIGHRPSIHWEYYRHCDICANDFLF